MKTKTGKQAIFTISLIILGSTVFGQRYYSDPDYGPDSASRRECAMSLSVMSEYVKINSLDLAYDAWRYCFFNCPKASKNIYVNGAKIVKNKIENEEDETTRNAWVDTLMMLYDQRIQYFQQAGYVNGFKGIDLLRYRKSAIEEAYGYLEKSVDMRDEKVDESVAITFISTTYALMEQGVVGPDVMINNYVKIMDLLEQKVASGDKDARLPQAIESVEKIFAESGAADCESLINIFKPKFQENPDDVDLLKKITNLLSQTKCEDSELYAQAAEKLFSLEPSAEAAAKLGALFAIKEEYKKATSYFNQAIAQETDNARKADYYFALGKVAFQQKDYPTVRKHCLSAISLKSDFGDAYMLIGSAYAASSTSCFEDDVMQKTVYWAAVDMFAKAKSADPSIKEKADEQIRTYSQYFPNNEDIFMYLNKTDGESYTVGCWINEATIVRTRK
jgi:tetratricopeptide (TPR) repeat protein